MKNIVIIRDRGQLTIPDTIRKNIHWIAPNSPVTISVEKSDTIIIRPHTLDLPNSEIRNKISKARSIKGKSNQSASEFLLRDRQRK